MGKLQVQIKSLEYARQCLPHEYEQPRDIITDVIYSLRELDNELDSEPPKWMSIVVELVQYWGVMQLVSAYVFRSGNTKSAIVMTNAIKNAFKGQQLIRDEMLKETIRTSRRPINWANPDFNIGVPGYESERKQQLNGDYTAND